MRQAGATRRDLSRGVQRHAFGNRGRGNNPDSSSTLQRSRSLLNPVLGMAARVCFHKTFIVCSKLCLIQLVQLEVSGGKIYTFAPTWKGVLHVLVVLLLGTNIVRHTWVTWGQLETMGMDAMSAISLCGSWAILAQALISLGILMQPEQAAELLNSWSTVLNSFIQHTKMASVWNDPVVCTQVIGIVTGQTILPILFPLLGLAMPNTPIFLVPSTGRDSQLEWRPSALAMLGIAVPH